MMRRLQFTRLQHALRIGSTSTRCLTHVSVAGSGGSSDAHQSLFLALLAGTALALSSDSIAWCGNDRVSRKDLAVTLRELIKDARAKLQQAGRPAPLLTINTIDFEGKTPGQSTETHAIEVTFRPKECNPTLLVRNWLTAFEEPAAACDAHLDKFHAFYSDANASSLSLVSANGTASMTVTKHLANGESKVSVQLFKDNGYTRQQLQQIVQGYSEGFGYTPKMGQKAVQFKFKPVSSEDASSLLRGLLRGPRGGDMDLATGDGDSSPSTGDPLEDLKALGVEVFDPSSNALMTWEQLAGYEDVKQRIQETVVLALQYPDVYDQVAKQTRAFFESNRPKAVLLEGPPGTGKTLTARILASQCEAPLIVLNLESIVSKWYGDSEKKLSKILDAADRIEGGAILFVDEIDALAVTRDSESGVHEVTRRVLSVLLTRLEGFKGKSKSIMICTTNRKQDLDPALLSRFDLTITYTLPSFPTRQEIFKRYAKQFKGEEAYRALAEASEGLSCRDIKEACQQAERICASRFIQQQKKNKSSAIAAPELKDYLACLEQRQAQLRSVGMLGKGAGDPSTNV